MCWLYVEQVTQRTLDFLITDAEWEESVVLCPHARAVQHLLGEKAAQDLEGTTETDLYEQLSDVGLDVHDLVCLPGVHTVQLSAAFDSRRWPRQFITAGSHTAGHFRCEGCNSYYCPHIEQLTGLLQQLEELGEPTWGLDDFQQRPQNWISGNSRAQRPGNLPISKAKISVETASTTIQQRSMGTLGMCHHCPTATATQLVHRTRSLPCLLW